MNSASEFEAGSWVYFPRSWCPQLWMKRISKCTCMHLLTHPRRHGAYRESMWNHVNPPCRPLHHRVYTINIGVNSNILTNFYQPLSWLFEHSSFLLMFEQFQLLSLTGHSASPKNSFFPGNGLSDSRLQPTSCDELDVSPKRDAVFFFSVEDCQSYIFNWLQALRPAAWNQQQEERIGIYWNKPTNAYCILTYIVNRIQTKTWEACEKISCIL